MSGLDQKRGSEIDSFLSCRKRYVYEYVDQIEAKKVQKPLYFGTVMHKFIEANHTKDCLDPIMVGRNLFDDTNLSEMPQEEVIEMKGLYETLANDYVSYWYTQDFNRRTLATELKFRVPVHEELSLVGTIDHLYIDRTSGSLWLEDHKTVKSISSYMRGLEYNRQATRYLYAVDLLDKGIGEIMLGDTWVPVRDTGLKFGKPVGMIFNLISKNPARAPKVLKNLSLSMDKTQRTTYAIYLEALQDKHPEGIPATYNDFLDYLESLESEEGNRFFRRVKVFRTDAEKKDSFNTIANVSQEIINLAPNPEMMFRSEGMQCGWCQYKAVCYAERAGENVEMILDTMYQPKTEGSPYEEDEVEIEEPA